MLIVYHQMTILNHKLLVYVIITHVQQMVEQSLDYQLLMENYMVNLKNYMVMMINQILDNMLVVELDHKIVNEVIHVVVRIDFVDYYYE